MKIFTLSVSVFLAGAVASPATACDLCAVYSASEAQGDTGKGWLAGVAEQFSHFGTMQIDGVKVPNDVHQYLDSSISQLFVGYNFTKRFGLQFNLPLIDRTFKRPDGFAIDRGTVSGIGDASLIGHLNVARRETMHSTVSWSLIGGLKFPTGSSARIAEELNEVAVPGAPESGIHGHDLTLGTGSVDGILGTSLFAQWHRAFFTANLQYTLRTTGDFDYRFANDLTWSGGPGAYLLLGDVWTASAQLNISGEHKGLDRFHGDPGDTGITALYLGPQFRLSWNSRLSLEVAADFPVSLANTALQTVPDYRLRGGLTWRF